MALLKSWWFTCSIECLKHNYMLNRDFVVLTLLLTLVVLQLQFSLSLATLTWKMCLSLSCTQSGTNLSSKNKWFKPEVTFLFWFLINRYLYETPLPFIQHSSLTHLLSYCFASQFCHLSSITSSYQNAIKKLIKQREKHDNNSLKHHYFKLCYILE